MSYKIVYDVEVREKFLENRKIDIHARRRISYFINIVLFEAENPFALKNARKLKGTDNFWRWRIGDYRIIGKEQSGEVQIIEIVKIAKRDENTYKGL